MTGSLLLAKSLSGYGAEYEHKLTKRQARALCGMYPLPAMGREMLVAITGAWKPQRRLYVQNVSGLFVLASSDTKREDWGRVFGVDCGPRLTFTAAREQVRAAGCTLTRRDGGEFRVNLIGGTEATACYTDDLRDAVGTAQDMGRRAAAAAAGVRS